MSTTVDHNDDCVPTTSTTMSSAHRAVQSVLDISDKGRSTIEGDSYHLRLAIMIILRAYRMRQLDNKFDFAVAMEVAAAGKFDDILYHYASPRLASGTLFIQAKHKQNNGSMIEEDGLRSPWDANTSFSIPKYFVSFLEIDQKLPNDARYVLCTNAGLHEKIKSYFKDINPQQDDSMRFCEVNPQQDNSLQFCRDIGATCYQFDCDKPFPALIAALKDSCFAKLGKELAQTIFKEKVITFNDTLFDTFSDLINDCVEPVEQETSDSSVSIYKLTKAFSNDNSKPIATVRKAFEKEQAMLCKRKTQKSNNKTTDELIIKIDSDSYTSAKNTQKPDLEKFDQKVREFYGKFLLVCNSFNEEKLREQAFTLLPQWCDAERETSFDKLQGKLLDAMKSVRSVPLDLMFWQTYFANVDLNHSINDLMRYSTEYLEKSRKKHPHIEINLERLKDFKLYAFLKDESGCGTYEFNSTLDLTVSSRIVAQALSLLQHETLFIDSTKFAKQEEMNEILDDLLSYLRDVNHPTIKVVTILGKPDTVSIEKIKEFSEKYHQKIVLVEEMSECSQNDKTFERILVEDLSDEASRQLYKQTDRMMFGTNTPLSRIVEDTDNLSFLINVNKVCEFSEIEDRNLNELNYEQIKPWYVKRRYVPFKQENDKKNNKDSIHIIESESEESEGNESEGSVVSEGTEESEELEWTERSKVSVGTERLKKSDSNDFQKGDGGKVCIFLNNAGLGKSTYFTWLAWCLSTSDQSQYVIKFNAMEYSTDFERLKHSDVEHLGNIEIVRILYRYIHLALFVPSITSRKIEETDEDRRKADLCANLLTFSNGWIILDETKNNELSRKELIELRLFREKFNEQKIVLILDGFDEIAPYYKDVVMSCFSRFARLDGVQSLFLSSRPYGFEEDLKKAFDQCRIYRLKPFSEKDIIFSFNQFLLSNLEGYEHYEKNHQNNILEAMLDITVNVMKGLESVPLLLYMVQIILLPVIRNHVNEQEYKISKQILDDTKIDILYLVEQFVDKKIKILNTDKIGTTDSAGTSAAAKRNEDRLKKEMKKQHMLLAMYVIFDKTDREKLLSTEEQKRADEIMEEVNQGDEKTGIVLGVQSGVPQFLHRTFAEYFSACWLFENWERFKSESIFRSQSIWSDSLTNTREFFDRLILKESESCDLHLALVNRSYENFEKILRNNPSAVTTTDKVGRMPLHLADYSEYRTMKSLLEKMPPRFVNEQDNLYGWNALDYAFVLDKKDLIQTLFQSVVKYNMDTLFQQVCSNHIDVLLVKENINGYIFDHFLNRKDLAAELSKRVSKYLVEDKQIDIYSPLAELNALSVLERVVTLNSFSMFRQLMSKSDPQALALDNRSNRYLQLALKKRSNNITCYLIEQHPPLVAMINDNEKLFCFAERAIKNNQMELFKTIFGEICIKQKIECVHEDYIIDDCEDQGENESFEIEIPFVGHCCKTNDISFKVFCIETTLSAAIHYGNAQMTRYILQKTNMNVTFDLIRKIVLEIGEKTTYNKNHKKIIFALKLLFQKTPDLYAVDEEGLNLFLIIIKYGCVYMLPSLIAIGFDPKKSNTMNHWDVLQYRLFESSQEISANIFVYLQQRTYVDFFDTLGPTGASIFQIAITKKLFIVAAALWKDKLRNLSDTEKEIQFWMFYNNYMLDTE